MERDIQKKRASIQTEFHKSTRHTIQVDYISFMDELAKLVGVKPKIYKHLDIFWQLVFGVVTPVQYRLDGPGKMPNAAEVIKDLCHKKRVAPISPKLAMYMPNAEM
jgi:dimethylaniline monooxygenase (N-oxide forming)